MDLALNNLQRLICHKTKPSLYTVAVWMGRLALQYWICGKWIINERPNNIINKWINTKNNNLLGGLWQEGQFMHAWKYRLPGAKKGTTQILIDTSTRRMAILLVWEKHSSLWNSYKLRNKSGVWKYLCLFFIIHSFSAWTTNKKKRYVNWDKKK